MIYIDSGSSNGIDSWMHRVKKVSSSFSEFETMPMWNCSAIAAFMARWSEICPKRRKPSLILKPLEHFRPGGFGINWFLSVLQACFRDIVLCSGELLNRSESPLDTPERKISGTKVLGNLFQHFPDREMVGASAFALATFDACGGFCVQCGVASLCPVCQAVAGQVSVKDEYIGN